MFSENVQLVFKAQTVLAAAQRKDPRFEQLVASLMERLSITREQVILNIVELAKGNTSI